MRRPALVSALAVLLLPSAPAAAMVGNAYVVPNAASRPEVMLIGSRGNFCTGVAVARDLILTAAHCVQAGAEYKLVELDDKRQPILKDVRGIARHPQFNLKTMLAHRATADVALVKLAAPLNVTPVPLMGARARVAVGERFAVYGYGMAVRTDANTSATLRAATLVAAGQPGNLQLRLVDPATGGKSDGLGACTGDFGRAGLSGRRRLFRRDGRGELVDRRRRQRRLRRLHRGDADRALPLMDRRHRGEARQSGGRAVINPSGRRTAAA